MQMRVSGERGAGEQEEEKKREGSRNLITCTLYTYVLCMARKVVCVCVCVTFVRSVTVPTRKLGRSNLLVTVLLRVDMWPGIVQVEVPASTSSSVYCEPKQCLSVCCDVARCRRGNGACWLETIRAFYHAILIQLQLQYTACTVHAILTEGHVLTL